MCKFRSITKKDMFPSKKGFEVRSAAKSASVSFDASLELPLRDLLFLLGGGCLKLRGPKWRSYPNQRRTVVQLPLVFSSSGTNNCDNKVTPEPSSPRNALCRAVKASVSVWISLPAVAARQRSCCAHCDDYNPNDSCQTSRGDKRFPGAASLAQTSQKFTMHHNDHIFIYATCAGEQMQHTHTWYNGTFTKRWVHNDGSLCE